MKKKIKDELMKLYDQQKRISKAITNPLLKKLFLGQAIGIGDCIEILKKRNVID